MHVLKVFSGTKTQFLCNKDSFFLDVIDEDTATMHLGEIAEARGVSYIDECCDDLLFTHNDDVWYRENIKNSFFFFFNESVKRWQSPLFGLSGVTQENMKFA